MKTQGQALREKDRPFFGTKTAVIGPRCPWEHLQNVSSARAFVLVDQRKKTTMSVQKQKLLDGIIGGGCTWKFWTQLNSMSWNWTVYPSFRAQDKPCINKRRNASWSLLIFARKIHETLQETAGKPSESSTCFFFWWGTLQKNQINTKIGSNKPQIKHIKRGWIILLNPSKNLQGWPSNCPIFAPELPRSDPKLSCIHHHIVLQQYLPPNSKAGRVTWNPPPGRRKTW